MINLIEQYKNTFEPALLEQIQMNGTIHSFEEGQEIISYGQNIRFMPLILEGSIKVYREGDSGEILLYYVNPLESCSMTFTCCMQNKKSQIKAIAETPTTIITIPIDFMDRWMNTYPTWKSFVMNTIQERFDELLKTIDQIAFNKLDERLMGYLENKAKINQSNEIQVSHQEIAKDLSTSRVVISRLLKQLEHQGEIKISRQKITLL